MTHNNELKFEILEIKKNFAKILAENQLLKVKVRKLENDNIRKNKQIECLIDPKECNNIRKIVSERGAMMLIQLKERCEKLESEVLSKDLKIRKLETEIERLKAFSRERKKRCKNTNNSARLSYQNQKISKYFSSFRSSPITSSTESNERFELNEHQKLADNLRKIKQVKHFLTDCEITLEVNQNTPKEKLNECDKSCAEENAGNGENTQNQINQVVDEMKTIKETVLELYKEYREMRINFETKCTNYDDLSSQIKILEKKMKNKKFVTLPIKKKYKNQKSPMQNVNYCNITHKSENTKIEDSDDNDVHTGN